MDARTAWLGTIIHRFEVAAAAKRVRIGSGVRTLRCIGLPPSLSNDEAAGTELHRIYVFDMFQH